MTELTEKARFGVDGLDDITAGGLARGRLYLLEGSPGTGKTTIATQFLIEGRPLVNEGSTSPFPRPMTNSAQALPRTAGISLESTSSN